MQNIPFRFTLMVFRIEDDLFSVILIKMVIYEGMEGGLPNKAHISY